MKVRLDAYSLRRGLARAGQRAGVVALSLLFVFSSWVSAGSGTVFRGRPSVKISEGGASRIPEVLSREKAVSSECIISEIDGKYYWASRKNIQLFRVEAGAFVTFVAANGGGYVRLIKKGLKPEASLMSESEEKFDYVEHLLQGLRSVTYYGAERDE